VDQKGQVSPDGQWFWDGQTWLSTLSPDGRWRWNGTNWVASVISPVRKPWAAGIWWIPGLRTGASWKLPVIAVAFLLLLAGINSLASQPPSSPTGQAVVESRPSPSPSATPEAASSPLPVAQSPSPKPSPSPSPTPKATPSPQTAASAAAPPPPPPPSTCGAPANPWGYNFCGGNLINNPPSNFCSYFNCIASFWKSTLGYVDECNDGTYSHSGGRQGACSSHHGEMRPLFS
jgi:hypothetical protein